MMADIKEFMQLKKNVEQAQAQADRATGAAEQIMRQLQEVHGCDTIEDAQKKLRTKEKEKDKLQEEFDTAFEEYKEKWQNES